MKMTELSSEIIIKIGKRGPPPALKYGPEYDEVFDPFEFEGERYFLYYMASFRCWFIGRPLDTARTDPLLPPQTNEPAKGTLAWDLWSFFPQPFLRGEQPTIPALGEPNTGTFQGPFWYRDTEFMWFSIGGGDWILAECSKRGLDGARNQEAA